MSPVTMVVYILIISAITLANLILWLRLRTRQDEVEGKDQLT